MYTDLLSHLMTLSDLKLLLIKSIYVIGYKGQRFIHYVEELHCLTVGAEIYRHTILLYNILEK